MVIAVEGMDGSGKTMVCEYIKKKYQFQYIEKPTKYLFEQENQEIEENLYQEMLQLIYESNESVRTSFFGAGNVIAANRFGKNNIVIDRHIASNYYHNGTKELDAYYDKLIRLCGNPTITILLHASVSVRMERLYQRNKYDSDLDDEQVKEDGTQKWKEFLENYKFPYVIIDTTKKSRKSVFQEIDQIIVSYQNGNN